MWTTAKSKCRLRRKRMQGMQRVIESKLAELQRLQHERERLEVRHATVTALAEAFALLREWEAQDEGTDEGTDADDAAVPTGSAAAAAGGEPAGEAEASPVPQTPADGGTSTSTHGSNVTGAASEEEAQLLSQLERLPLSFGSISLRDTGSSTLAGDDDDPGDAGDEPRPIAPADDPLLLLRELRGRRRGMEGLTLAHVHEVHGAAVREMALQLQVLESGSDRWLHSSSSGGSGPAAAAAATPSPHERLRAAVLRQLRLFSAMSRSAQLVADFQLTNALTGERLQQPNEQQHRWLLTQLRLSPTQLRRIAAGTGVLRELHGRILAQLRAAQAECAAAAAASEAAAVERGGGRALEEHLGQLERQDSSSARVEALLRKEWRFRAATAAYFFGCLSYKQAAKLFVLFWPVYFVPYLLLRLVEEQEQQSQQAQQQDGQQQDGQQQQQAAVAGRLSSRPRPRTYRGVPA